MDIINLAIVKLTAWEKIVFVVIQVLVIIRTALPCMDPSPAFVSLKLQKKLVCMTFWSLGQSAMSKQSIFSIACIFDFMALLHSKFSFPLITVVTGIHRHEPWSVTSSCLMIIYWSYTRLTVTSPCLFDIRQIFTSGALNRFSRARIQVLWLIFLLKCIARQYFLLILM